MRCVLTSDERGHASLSGGVVLQLLEDGVSWTLPSDAELLDVDHFVAMLDLATEVTYFAGDHGLDLEVSSVVRSFKSFKFLLKLKIILCESLEVCCELLVDLDVKNSLVIKGLLSLYLCVS